MWQIVSNVSLPDSSYRYLTLKLMFWICFQWHCSVSCIAQNLLLSKFQISSLSWRSRNSDTLFWCTWSFNSSLLPLFRLQRELRLFCRAMGTQFSDQTFILFTTLPCTECFSWVMDWLKRLRWGSILTFSRLLFCFLVE